MENNNSVFRKNFRNCCNSSCSQLAYEHQQTDESYIKMVSECNTLYRLLKEKLGDDSLLLNQFDAAKNHLLAFDDEYIYEQGFQDCVYLLRYIGLL